MQPRSMISAKAQAGKVYELWILCRLLETLDRKEQFDVELVGGEQLTLRSSPGGIKEKFPHFELHREGERFDVWTDIEFLTLSHARRGSMAEQYGDYHELDIAIVEHGSRGRPRHDRVVLGVECKDRSFGKDLLRGVLGVRRELSLLALPERTRFRSWPRRTVPARSTLLLLRLLLAPERRRLVVPRRDLRHRLLPRAPALASRPRARGSDRHPGSRRPIPAPVAFGELVAEAEEGEILGLRLDHHVEVEAGGGAGEEVFEAESGRSGRRGPSAVAARCGARLCGRPSSCAPRSRCAARSSGSSASRRRPRWRRRAAAPRRPGSARGRGSGGGGCPRRPAGRSAGAARGRRRGRRAVVVLHDQPRPGRPPSSARPSSKRPSAASRPPAAPPTWVTTTASGPSPIASSTEACSSKSSAAAARTSARSEFSTAYWPGWKESRRPSARGRARRAPPAPPRTPPPARGSCGMSGWLP